MHFSHFLLATAFLVLHTSAHPAGAVETITESALHISQHGSSDFAPKELSKGNPHGTTHRVHQVAGGRKRPGAVAYADLHKKHGITPHPDVTKAAARKSAERAAAVKQTGSVKATPWPSNYDREYLVNITIGGHPFVMDFDTGSSDLWVASTLLPREQRGKKHLYTLTGQEIEDESWAIGYGDHSGASGVVYADKVTVGGITATIQAVEAATSISASFVGRDDLDGLLGLAAIEGNRCQPYYCNTFMDQVGKHLKQNLFTVDLKRHAPGQYDFGFIDKTKYTGSIVYTDIQDYQGLGFWEIYTHGWQVGNGKLTNTYMDTIVDTGSSINTLEPSIVNVYWAKVPGAHYNTTEGGWIFPCANESKLPSLTFLIENQKRTMPGYLANYAKIDDFASDHNPGFCYGGIQANAGAGELQILGDTFIQSQFVVFDRANQRVGFGQKPTSH